MWSPFVLLSLVIHNDIVCYNLLRAAGMIATGLGTFALAWYVVRNRPAAILGGLLAMLSGPMMLHGHGHLELVYLGSFPVFLLAWLRFLEQPTWRRLVAATALYLLMSACAGYYMVMGTVPAAFALIWTAFQHRPEGLRGQLRSRAAWLAAFVAAVLPCLVLMFFANLWGAAHGFSVRREWRDVTITGAPLLGYWLPTPLHPLGAILPSPYTGSGHYQEFSNISSRKTAPIWGSSRSGLPRLRLDPKACSIEGGSIWWGMLALLVVLSMGTVATIAGHKVVLPSGWLWWVFPPFRLIRCTARFNLLAAVIAAVLASAGLSRLLERFRSRPARLAVCGLLASVAVADLSMVPYFSHRLPEPPPVYAAIRQLDPQATLLEMPQQQSCMDLSRLDWTYWQSVHRLSTSAGYSGMKNERQDRLILSNSPFLTGRERYLADPDHERFGIVNDVRFRDYAWLFLTVHGFRYVVSHQRASPRPGHAAALERLDDQLKDTRVFDDTEATVYQRDRLSVPSKPVALCTSGWECVPGETSSFYMFLADQDAANHRVQPRTGVRLGV